MTVAVVIPFYQKTAGLLPRALQSIADQEDVADVEVVVVDDASPIPARAEIERLGDAQRGLPVRIVEQANAGPAAARNRGLDALGPQVTRVAFLDSDDVWTPRHLAHANEALDVSFDVYFSDLYQPGQDVSGFARAGRIDSHCRYRSGNRAASSGRGPHWRRPVAWTVPHGRSAFMHRVRVGDSRPVHTRLVARRACTRADRALRESC